MAQERASTLLSRSHNQQDESLKVCQVAFAAGKQPELYNSAGVRFPPHVASG